MNNLVIINGSPRKNGRTGLLGNYLHKTYGGTYIDVSKEQIPLFNGEESQYEIPAVKHLEKAATNAKGFIICSPEYHNGMSGALKNMLDFLGGDHFQHKPVVILAVAGGGKGGINALNNMRIVLRGLYANVLPTQLVLDPPDFQGDTIAQGVRHKLDAIVKELFAHMK